MTRPENISAIHSVPRSGSSWLGEIINSHPCVTYKFQPLFSYELKSAISDTSGKDELERFFSTLAATNSEFLDQTRDRENGTKPRFRKANATHLVYKEVRYHYVLENLFRKLDSFRAILLIRCPLATLASFMSAPREFRKDLGWDFAREWRFAQSKNGNRREDYFGYEKWKEAGLQFLNLNSRFPERALIINFNDLIANPLETTAKMFDFLGLEVHEQTRAFLAERAAERPRTPYSVYNFKDADGAWKDLLASEIHDYVIEDLRATPLRDFLSVSIP